MGSRRTTGHVRPGRASSAASVPEPDVIVSGINAGANTGRVILHSGTVGAALTAQNFGLRALAVSLAERTTRWRWGVAAALAVQVTDASSTPRPG